MTIRVIQRREVAALDCSSRFANLHFEPPKLLIDYLFLDFKPENLLLTSHDLNFIGSDKAGVRLKLADFGLAYEMKEDEPKLFTVCGKCENPSRFYFHPLPARLCLGVTSTFT